MHDASILERPAPADRTASLDDALRRLFGDVGPDVLAGIREASTVRALRGGDVLFREGDLGDAAFVVVTGRLRAATGPADDERVLSDATHGETIADPVSSGAAWTIRYRFLLLVVLLAALLGVR